MSRHHLQVDPDKHPFLEGEHFFLPGKKHPTKAPKRNAQRHLTDEQRERCREWGRQGGAKGRRTAVPDGYTKAEVKIIREKADQVANQRVQQMTEIFPELKDDDAARKALGYAVSVVEAKVDATRDRLAAARLVLDYTKQKPASNHNMTISAAEEFLKALANEDTQDGDTATGTA